jgi:hypothetical protein
MFRFLRSACLANLGGLYFWCDLVNFDTPNTTENVVSVGKLSLETTQCESCGLACDTDWVWQVFTSFQVITIRIEPKMSSSIVEEVLGMGNRLSWDRRMMWLRKTVCFQVNIQEGISPDSITIISWTNIEQKMWGKVFLFSSFDWVCLGRRWSLIWDSICRGRTWTSLSEIGEKFDNVGWVWWGRYGYPNWF